jgi:hypothetical protein
MHDNSSSFVIGCDENRRGMHRSQRSLKEISKWAD